MTSRRPRGRRGDWFAVAGRQRSRALYAEFGAGSGGESAVGAHADGDQHDVGVEADRLIVWPGCVDLEAVWQSGGCGLDAVDSSAAKDGDFIAVELGADEGAEVGIDSGENFGELLDLGDSEAGGCERFRHFEADVSGADDHCAAGLAVLEGAHERERVAHRVQEMHSLARAEVVEPDDGGSDRNRPGADDERVVLDALLATVGGGERDTVGGRSDVLRDRVEPQLHAGGLKLSDGAVGEVVPVGDLSAHVIGDAANRLVRVGVGEHNRYLHGWV